MTPLFCVVGFSGARGGGVAAIVKPPSGNVGEHRDFVNRIQKTGAFPELPNGHRAGRVEMCRVVPSGLAAVGHLANETHDVGEGRPSPNRTNESADAVFSYPPGTRASDIREQKIPARPRIPSAFKVF